MRFLPSMALLFCACGSSGPTALLTVAASASAQDIASTPWPSDLFLDDSGHVAIAQLPTDMVALTQPLLDDFNKVQDGFGVASGAFFPTSEPADPATVDGNVHLYDLADGSELPVLTHVRALDLPPSIYARPVNGGALLEKHQYAYVVTSKVRGKSGGLVPSADLAGILAHRTAPSGSLLHAWNIYKPLLDLLDSGPIRRQDVAAATVFTTHSVTTALASMRASLAAAAPPKAMIALMFAKTMVSGVGTLDNLLGTPTSKLPGNDNAGGISHDHLGWVVQGSFQTPDYLNDASAPNAMGVTPTSVDVFANDGPSPTVKATATIPFTLVIPDLGAAPSAYANLPVVIFQHGLNGDRADMMGLADSLAQKGIAVAGIDIPFHGARQASAMDIKHSFGGGTGSDGWADDDGSPFLDFFDAKGNARKGIPTFEPAALRSSFRQAAIDMMQLARLITAGDLSGIGARDARLAQLTLRHDALGYSGESFGSIIGGMTCAIEPTVGAAFFDVGGGGMLFPLLLNSAEFGPMIAPFLDGAFGTNTAGGIDPPESDWAYNAMAALIEQADPAAYAPYVVLHPIGGNAPKHVLMPSAHYDETVPNQANEDMARAMGLVPVTLPSGGNVDLQFWPVAPTPLTAPVSGNLTVGSAAITGAFIQMEEASHGMLLSQHGKHNDDLTQPYPYPRLPAPVPIMNPIVRLQAIYASWFADYFAGRVPSVVSGQ
jgi:hypothetical protein